MTYEEAAGIMRQLISQAIVLGRASGKPTLDRIRIEAIYKAVEALEKQIPKKPIFEREQISLFGVDDDAYCPNCRCSIPKVKYCEDCGQAIDWGKDNE